MTPLAPTCPRPGDRRRGGPRLLRGAPRRDRAGAPRSRRYFYELPGPGAAGAHPRRPARARRRLRRGDLLAALEPRRGVGIDLSGHGDRGRARRPTPDADAAPSIRATAPTRACCKGWAARSTSSCMVNVVTHLADVQARFEAVCLRVPRAHARVRLQLQPAVAAAAARWRRWLGLKHRQPPEAWLPPEEIRNMLELADFEVVRARLPGRAAAVRAAPVRPREPLPGPAARASSCSR